MDITARGAGKIYKHLMLERSLLIYFSVRNFGVDVKKIRTIDSQC